MAKSIGMFSDLHGDKQSLELIVKTLKYLGVDSTLFLGDMVYKTMSQYTTHENQKASKIRELLRQESPLRKELLDGNFSDEQLQMYSDIHKHAKNVGNKISKAEYEDFQQTLSGLDYTILGGNWDYREGIQEVFGDRYLNASSRETAGLNVLGFSGGGGPVNLSASTETLADDKRNQGNQFQTWGQALINIEQNLEADILISHVPFSDGEGVEQENAVEQLKGLVKDRRIRRARAGLEDDLPEVMMWGHRHSSGDVKYDEELKSFVVIPGCSSRNHNYSNPVFMVSEFDDNNKLIGARKFEIYCTLAGLGEVHEVGYYSINYETKEVEFEERNNVIVKDHNLSEFSYNLDLDDNFALTQQGLNVKYDILRDNSVELDLQVRKNIQIWFKESEEISGKIDETASDVALRNLLVNGELNADNLYNAVEEVELELFKLACKKMGANYDVLKDSEDVEFIRPGLIKSVLGVDYAAIMNLRNVKLKSKDDISMFGRGLGKSASENLNAKYQEHIFKDLEEEDFQAMAEAYIPACYERTKDLTMNREGFNLWIKSFQEGLITSDVVEETGAYKKKEGYVANKKTKEDLAEMFDFNQGDEKELADAPAAVPEELRDMISQDPILSRNGRAIRASNLPEEAKERIRDDINSGNVPAVRDSQGDYLALEDGNRIYLDDEFRKDLGDYQTMPEQDFMRSYANQLLRTQMEQVGNNPNLGNGYGSGTQLDPMRRDIGPMPKIED